MVLEGGLEPPRIAPYGPQPYASASSATRARCFVFVQGFKFALSLDTLPNISPFLTFASPFSLFSSFFLKKSLFFLFFMISAPVWAGVLRNFSGVPYLKISLTRLISPISGTHLPLSEAALCSNQLLCEHEAFGIAGRRRVLEPGALPLAFFGITGGSHLAAVTQSNILFRKFFIADLKVEEGDRKSVV